MIWNLSVFVFVHAQLVYTFPFTCVDELFFTLGFRCHFFWKVFINIPRVVNSLIVALSMLNCNKVSVSPTNLWGKNRVIVTSYDLQSSGIEDVLVMYIKQMSRKLLFENFLEVISEKKINKHLNKFNTLCYKWTEVMWLLPWSDTKGFKNG